MPDLHTIDLQTVVDVKELKSLAYDQIAAKEQAENNLRAIHDRMTQVLATSASAQGALSADAEKPDDTPAEPTAPPQ